MAPILIWSVCSFVNQNPANNISVWNNKLCASVIISSDGTKNYQSKSTEKTSNRTKYTRKYVQRVAEGDAFKRSTRSLARAWNSCTRNQISTENY